LGWFSAFSHLTKAQIPLVVCKNTLINTFKMKIVPENRRRAK